MSAFAEIGGGMVMRNSVASPVRGTALLAGVLAALAASGADAAEPMPELPGWLAGCWVAQEGDRRTEECWTEPRGGTMVGSAISAQGEELISWEAMRISLNESSGGANLRMAFIASPKGAGAVPFAWSPGEEVGVTFHNAANDYPQRVRYWREGVLLKAEIAMADGSKPMSWTYRRTK